MYLQWQTTSLQQQVVLTPFINREENEISSTAHIAYVLQMRTTTECSYLAGAGPEGMGPLQHVALFHSHDTSRGRGVYAIAMPMEHRSASHHCKQLARRHSQGHNMHHVMSHMLVMDWPHALPCSALLCIDFTVSIIGRQTHCLDCEHLVKASGSQVWRWYSLQIHQQVKEKQSQSSLWHQQ